MEAPRNILVIVADQFRADLLNGGALAAHVPTPHLDRLAGQSRRYLNHHTVTVPCGPSRASLLTGRYALRHGSTRNGTPLPRHFPTLPTELRKLGREPLLFGYTDTQPDPAGLSPADPAHRSYTAPAPGFTEVLEMREEAWEWLAHLRARGYDVPDAETAEFDTLYRPVTGKPGDPALYRAEDSETAFLTDRVLAQLDVRKSRPWCAFVTYIRPHPPYVAPGGYHDLIDPASLPAPAQGSAHPFFDSFHATPSEAGMFWGFDGRQLALSAEQIARTRATYLGLVAELDHHIGRLLDWLEATGQADDTLLVFTADHGEMLGDLTCWGKRTPLRQASHIPLLLRGPGVTAGKVTTPSESIDLAATILARLGGEVPAGMDGKALDQVEQATDPVAMVELELGLQDGTGPVEAATGQPPEHCRAVAFETAQWRLVHYGCGYPAMLFDVAGDPACTTDLAATRPDVVADLRARLLSHRLAQAC